eukprot:3669245-Karenia_brevis.AAC.1
MSIPPPTSARANFCQRPPPNSPGQGLDRNLSALSLDESMPPAEGERQQSEGVAQSTRWHCPVAGCPCANGSAHRGWRSLQSMQPHLNAHLSGQLPGHLTNSWLGQHGKARCRVCGLCVAASRGVHPTCSPAERAQQAPARSEGNTAQPSTPLPSLEQVHSRKARTLKYVHKRARSMWAQVLTRALALVTATNS